MVFVLIFQFISLVKRTTNFLHKHTLIYTLLLRRGSQHRGLISGSDILRVRAHGLVVRGNKVRDKLVRSSSLIGDYFKMKD